MPTSFRKLLWLGLGIALAPCGVGGASPAKSPAPVSALAAASKPPIFALAVTVETPNGARLRFKATSHRETEAPGAPGQGPRKIVIVTKPPDQNTPMLLQALTRNEVLRTVVLEFYAPGHEAQETVQRTVKLSNGVISGIQRVPSAPSPKGHDTHELEQITFTFDKITVTNPTSTPRARR